jgi:hypothetical protein
MTQSHQQRAALLNRKVFFLTCWNEQDKTKPTETWYFKLEIPGPNPPRLFKTLEEVMATIENELLHEQRAA